MLLIQHFFVVVVVGLWFFGGFLVHWLVFVCWGFFFCGLVCYFLGFNFAFHYVFAD